jgi:hypothetical protein
MCAGVETVALARCEKLRVSACSARVHACVRAASRSKQSCRESAQLHVRETDSRSDHIIPVGYANFPAAPVPPPPTVATKTCSMARHGAATTCEAGLAMVQPLATKKVALSPL